MRIFATLCIAELAAFAVSRLENIKLELQIIVLAFAALSGALIICIRAIELYRNWRDRNKTAFPPPPRLTE